jgi:hypothetical protein
MADFNKWLGRAAKEIPGVLLTGSRYLLAERMAQNVKKNKPITNLMAGFVLADLLDGAVLRKVNMDTPARRTADGIIDHLSMWRLGKAMADNDSEVRPYFQFLIARAAMVGTLNTFHLLVTGEVTKGQNHQRAANLSVAAFAVAAQYENDFVTRIAGSVAVAVNAVTVVPHLRDLGQQHDDGVRKL